MSYRTAREIDLENSGIVHLVDVESAQNASIIRSRNEVFTYMKQPRRHYERPDFQEHPLGAEVTAYLSSPDRV
jgi:coenzyme PQQ precursor peptide PqqA